MPQMASGGGKALLGKVALVTGASRGIGRAVAAAYVREGASVLICAREEAELKRAVAAMQRGDGSWPRPRAGRSASLQLTGRRSRTRCRSD